MGRLGLLGLVLAAALAVGLGFRIESTARSNLLQGRASILAQVVADLPISDFSFAPESPQFGQISEEVEHRLLGGETVRVKMWAPDGTIIYSDAEALIGEQFELHSDLIAGLAGEFSHKTADVDGASNVFDREFGRLIEFYLPVRDDSGSVIGVLEVYERSAPLDQSLSEIRSDVWWSVGIGLTALVALALAVGVSTARSYNRSRRQAEELAISITRAREGERSRLVNALHDDVSQPLYRILFGLQGCRHRVSDPAVSDEMVRLEGLTREIESRIRSELRRLHGSVVEETGLQVALSELVDTARRETDLEISLDVDDSSDLRSEAGSAVYRSIQESLFNIRRHAGASAVSIAVTTDNSTMVAIVSDNGVGWNGNEGIGLVTTRQILQSVRGDLKIRLRRPRGTTVRITVPTEAVPT